MNDPRQLNISFYKSFNFESFHNELNELLKTEKDINYSLFENIFPQVLNARAPVKKKIQGLTTMLLWQNNCVKLSCTVLD